MDFPTLEEVRHRATLTRDEAIEVYEDALAFNETLLEFARSEEEHRTLLATMRELRTSINQLGLESSHALFAVPHRTLVVAFGHAPNDWSPQ